MNDSEKVRNYVQWANRLRMSDTTASWKYYHEMVDMADTTKNDYSRGQSFFILIY